MEQVNTTNWKKSWNRGLHISGMSGKKHSEEAKKKLSLAHKGKKYKPMSEEGRKNISLAHIGKKLSVATRKKMSKSRMEENNGFWKGDKIKYGGLHQWVSKMLGKPRFCEDCGNREFNHRQYHWANISRQYKRILSDWRRLCVKCHKKFDKRNQ